MVRSRSRKKDEIPDSESGKRGLLLIFTGKGKGKTTAAFGTALRAAGHGMKVAIFQFLKGRRPSGERMAVEHLPGVRIETLGSGFTWEKESLEQDRRLAQEGWRRAESALRSGRYHLVVLDELNVVLDYGLLSVNDVAHALESRSRACHVVVTGRGAPEEILSIADCITEMRPVKHHYGDQGIRAQKGIEY